MLISLGAIAAVWWWLATPITLAHAPIDPEARLQCVSYAPFRNGQTPLAGSTQITAAEVEQDLAQLAQVTDCIRTYSIENNQDIIAGIAKKFGLKVIQGIWLSSNRFKNINQISTVVRLTRDYPDTITAVVAGNEVLLRGEMTEADLVAIIRSVKSQVTVPITYADVWEYWRKYRQIADAVDFITIHILPYWEDVPIRARFAADHVDSIRQEIAANFPGKEVLIGETGWPSAGRMREGALPSRTNQARVVSEILQRARSEHFRVNLIEAYDQPWKRQLEGTVGGYWGLFDSVRRTLKYPPGQPISNFPLWKWQMAAGMVLSVLVFAAAATALRRRPWTPRPAAWVGVAVSATTAGVLLGVAADKMFYESYGAGGWLQWGALLAAAVISPLLCANALMSGRSLPTLLELLGPRSDKPLAPATVLLGLSLVVSVVIGSGTALGFVFDPRYHDFPFASLTMAVVPFALLSLNRPPGGERPVAEAVFAGLLLIAAIFTAVNEGRENWQSLWTCTIYALFALTLWRARVVQIPK